MIVKSIIFPWGDSALSVPGNKNSALRQNPIVPRMPTALAPKSINRKFLMKELHSQSMKRLRCDSLTPA